MFGKPDIQPDAVTLDHVSRQTKHFFTAIDCPISVVHDLSSNNDGGPTLHIEVDVSSRKEEIQYKTAANLAILPINNASIVDSVAKALSFNLDAVFQLKCSKGKCDGGCQYLFPTPCTVRNFLSRYCDLMTPPRRSELHALANYATNALEKKALLRMSSKKGWEEYKEKILGRQVGIADIVCKFCPSISMPLEHFMFLCPRLQPRFYAIAWSLSLHPHSVHLTVGSMHGALKHGHGGEWFGVCSGHLSNIATNVNGSLGGASPPTCRIFVRSSTFCLPSDVGNRNAWILFSSLLFFQHISYSSDCCMAF
jgi:NADPH-ferrihemoprotein reductase